MTESPEFQLTVRTPHELILDTAVRGLRVLTETGHVGLRPRIEPLVLAVEAGIVNCRLDGPEAEGSERYVGTAGGLLICDRMQVTILTPLAVVGDDEAQLVEALQRVLNQPNSEMTMRATLGRLETRILKELRHDQVADSARHIQESA